MKTATKRLLATALLALSILGVLFAFVDRTTIIPVKTTPAIGVGTENRSYLPKTIAAIAETPLSGTTYLNRFYIPAGYGWVKLHLKNTGKLSFNYTVQQGSPSGPLKGSGTVKPDQIITDYWTSPWSTGWYYVNGTSGSGNMKGTLGVRIGTNEDVLKQE
ncbi:MAG: hypothetical protein ACQEXV_23620 [Bacillota bacterium]